MMMDDDEIEMPETVELLRQRREREGRVLREVDELLESVRQHLADADRYQAEADRIRASAEERIAALTHPNCRSSLLPSGVVQAQVGDLLSTAYNLYRVLRVMPNPRNLEVVNLSSDKVTRRKADDFTLWARP